MVNSIYYLQSLYTYPFKEGAMALVTKFLWSTFFCSLTFFTQLKKKSHSLAENTYQNYTQLMICYTGKKMYSRDYKILAWGGKILNTSLDT